jgi:hypothetical protein
VNQFNQVSTFKDSISVKKTQENFYKTNTKLKSFMNQSYKTHTPNTEKTNNDIRLEGTIDVSDHHYTIEEQRKRMASTFQPTVNNGGKFLPQVVATPHQVRTEDVFTKRGTAPMNMTGGFSTFNKGGGLIESMQDTNLSMSVDVKMETPTMPDDDYV